MMKTIKVTLRFPASKSKRPVTSCLIRDYNLVFNIFQARVDMGMEGVLTMELTGDEADLNQGLAFLSAEGIGVKELAHSVEWDGDKCISCGACTAVCGSGALSLDADARLDFDADKCVLCGRCVTACPMGVLKMND
jgi:NAD-dependent dihydropyrimidine dehydrogenase PreA subunit